MALKYFVEAGALAIRRVPKDDLKCVEQLRCAAFFGSLRQRILMLLMQLLQAHCTCDRGHSGQHTG
jgi:hypothetical protein